MQLKQTLASIAATLLLSLFAHATDNYKVDPLHTSVSFSVRHLGLTT
jgi:polyisoprenoid-binding protein YceI